MSNFSSRVIFVLFILMIVCSGCIKPKNILSKGLADVNDLVVFATAAPDNILVYSVNEGKMKHSLPADTRLNDMAVDKKGDIAVKIKKSIDAINMLFFNKESNNPLIFPNSFLILNLVAYLETKVCIDMVGTLNIFKIFVSTTRIPKLKGPNNLAILNWKRY